jgi:hypothetical protein
MSCALSAANASRNVVMAFTTRKKRHTLLSFFRTAAYRAVMAVATCVLSRRLSMLAKAVRQKAFPAVVIVEKIEKRRYHDF